MSVLLSPGVESSSKRGLEVELFPAAVHVGNALLAVFPEAPAIGDSGRVPEEPRSHIVVDGQHHHHAQFLGQCLESLNNQTRDRLRVLEKLSVLDLAEVWAEEELLEADHLGTQGSRLADILLVLRDHRLLVTGPIRLSQSRSNDVHAYPHAYRCLLSFFTVDVPIVRQYFFYKVAWNREPGGRTIRAPYLGDGRCPREHPEGHRGGREPAHPG